MSSMPPIAEVVADRVTEAFFKRFIDRVQSGDRCNGLWIVSPWFSNLQGEEISLEDILDVVRRNKIRTTVITRTPEPEYHRVAMRKVLRRSPVEVYFNDTLHAKMYIARNEDVSLALVGSANLSKTGLHGIEVGLLIRGVGWGSEVVQSLVQVGVNIRDQATTDLVKEFRGPVVPRFRSFL